MEFLDTKEQVKQIRGHCWTRDDWFQVFVWTVLCSLTMAVGIPAALWGQDRVGIIGGAFALSAAIFCGAMVLFRAYRGVSEALKKPTLHAWLNENQGLCFEITSAYEKTGKPASEHQHVCVNAPLATFNRNDIDIFVVNGQPQVGWSVKVIIEGSILYLRVFDMVGVPLKLTVPEALLLFEQTGQRLSEPHTWSAMLFDFRNQTLEALRRLESRDHAVMKALQFVGASSRLGQTKEGTKLREILCGKSADSHDPFSKEEST